MASVEHHITYYAKSFDDLITLVNCFVTSIPTSPMVYFKAEKINEQWRATLVYRGDYENYLTLKVTTDRRVEIQYSPELLVPQPATSAFICLVNGEEVRAESTVLLSASDILRITHPANTFSPGDEVIMSFCNSAGMKVNFNTCDSFSENLCDNTL